MKKLVCILLSFLFMTSLALSCGATGEEKAHPILKVRANYEIACLDPGYTVSNNEFITFMNIYDGLVEFDKGDLMTVTPDLAESWTISDDGTEYTFVIRDGVTFHNGDPLTVDDVVFSYERILVSPATASKASAIERVEKVDEKTMKMYLKYNYPNFINQLASYPYRIVSKAVVEANGDDNLDMVVGTGPYMLDRLVLGEGVYLKAHENHHQGAPYFDEVHIMIIPDDNTAMTALLTGAIDLNTIPTSLDLMEVENTESLAVTPLRMVSAYTLAMNVTRAPFDDIAVRQAISHAIDKDLYIDLVWDGEAYGDCISVLSPDEEGYSEDLPTFDYDVEKAKQLLADAGYSEGELTIDLTVKTTGYGPNFAAAFQQSMEAIGINVTVDPREQGAIINAMTSHDFHCVLGEVPSIPYNPPLTNNLYFKPGGSINMSQQSDEDILELIEKANVEPDATIRADLYNQAHTLFNERAYYVPFAYQKTNFGHAKELSGMAWEPGTLVTKYKYYSWEE